MRGRISILIAALSLIGFSSRVKADHHLEGTWQSEQSQIIITIESIKDGIRVRRSGQNRWYEYHEYRINQFRDSGGNTYYLLTGNTLEWEDQSGKKRIRFQKRTDSSLDSNGEAKQDNRDHADDYRGTRNGDRYLERNYIYSHQGSKTIVSTHSLNGRWINQTTGQVISIKSKNSRLRIKAHRGGWETFNRRDRNTFIDNHGNRYDASQNELTYTSKRGDFYMVFRRY